MHDPNSHRRPQSLSQLARRVRITSKVGRTKLRYAQMDDWQRHSHSYRVRLTYKRRIYSFDYFMGLALAHEPAAYDTLESLLSEAQCGDNSFEEFCAELGYDTDSRKAEATYKACHKTRQALQRFLGDDFNLFMDASRD